MRKLAKEANEIKEIASKKTSKNAKKNKIINLKKFSFFNIIFNNDLNLSIK